MLDIKPICINNRGENMNSIKTIYTCPEGKEKILECYDKMLSKLSTHFNSIFINTRFGKTHILTAGPTEGEPLIVFHGGNVVNPTTLKWFEPFAQRYKIYALDTIGHPGKSDEVRLSPRSDDYGNWILDILDSLNIEKAYFIGPSYGGGILFRFAAIAPQRIKKAIFLVPSAVANGSYWSMITKILIPLFMYRKFPSRKRLIKATEAMFDDKIDEDILEQVGYVYKYVILEKEFPKFITKKELENFTAPSFLIAAENDIFFPAKRIVPRAKQLIPNLVRVKVMEKSSHFQNDRNIEIITKEILDFLQEHDI